MNVARSFISEFQFLFMSRYPWYPGGLEMEGVYRVSGSQAKIRELKLAFNQGTDPAQSDVIGAV